MNVMFSHLLKVYFFIHTDWDSQSFILNKFLLWSLRLTYGQSLLEQSDMSDSALSLPEFQ